MASSAIGFAALLGIRRLRGALGSGLSPEQRLLREYGRWSIAIYEGSTPWDLAPAGLIANPVIIPEMVTDADALLVADPFMMRRDGMWYLFFEVLRRVDKRGVIAHATSDDGRTWSYGGIVLEESFHLSYPQVFEWEGEVYMVPESSADLSVNLYRAAGFPGGWERVATLLTGHAFVDATVFRHQDHWWMCVSTDANDVLNLYHSAHPDHGWQPHPLNPVVKQNPHHARSAGRVIEADGRLYRFAQDCAPDYGVSVFAFEITRLTPLEYAERIVSPEPLLTRSGAGWNSHGMHHIDAHPHDGRWIAAVDGKTSCDVTPRRPWITR